MATIGSTKSIPNPGFNPWTSKVELDTNTGAQKAYVYGGSGKLLYSGTPQEVVSQIPTNTSYNADKAFFDELISTIDGQSASLTAQYQQQVPPPANADPAVPPETENKPNPNNLGGTSAGDDTSLDKAEASKIAANNSETPGSNGEIKTLNDSFAGKTQAGDANIPTITITAKRPQSAGKKPGARLQNPLGNFSSYTYQLSLYMITPDAYNAFIESGRKNINSLTSKSANGSATNGGAFLIAQSGGVNNKASKRPPEFDLDFYIDDLKIKSLISTNAAQGTSNVSFISFNIYEPYGFSFMTKLKRAREQLEKESNIRNYEDAVNASRQFFILGVRFQGYDKEGNVANASQFFSEDTLNTGSDASGVYERFYDIIFESIKFTINGSATTYNVVAKMAPTTIGMGTAFGMVENMVPISAGTVKEALLGDGDGINSLIKTLNETQQALEKAGDITRANVYDIKFIGDTALLENASLVSKADPDKKKQPMSNADNTSEVNEGTSVKATPNTTKRIIQIAKGTPIQQAINNIIKQSSYMEDALEKILLSTESPNEDTDSPDVIPKKDVPPIQWYNLSAELRCLEFDPIVNDFAYKITYIIQPYLTPSMATPYSKSSKYTGPYKRYDYWFTGKNSEIISYDQKMDNTFFNVAIIPDDDPASHGGGTTTPTYPNKKQNQDSQGRLDVGMEAQNSYMTSLFDIGTYALAKIVILGDPDYLTQETVSGVNQAYNQFYGTDGFTINPNGSEVFIEIDFKEAVDYSNRDGLLDVNESIYFWNYPKAVASKIRGVSYKVRECESVFKSGKFTQTLICNINDIPEILEAENAEQTTSGRENPVDTANQNENYLLRNRGNRYSTAPNANARDQLLQRQSADVRTGSAQTGGNNATPSSGSSTSSASGYAKDRPPASSSSGSNSSTGSEPALTPKIQQPSTVTTSNTNKGVANDDSVQNAGQTQNGVANSQSPDAGRETQTGASLTSSRPGEGA